MEFSKRPLLVYDLRDNLPRNAHLWQVGLLDNIVLSEYPDKSHNFRNFLFMTSPSRDLFHFQSRFRFRFRCSLRGMAGISPKGVVVYHIFSEKPKVSQTFASCSSRFSFQKEIRKTDINESSSLPWIILEHTEIRMELISAEGKEWDQEAMSRTTMEAKCRRNWIKLGNKQMTKLHPDSKGIIKA